MTRATKTTGARTGWIFRPRAARAKREQRRILTASTTALKREFNRALRAVFLQIREHQGKDGAVGFPPGNAQNTVAMGPVFSTALAVLILNVQDSRLVFDEDYRVPSLF
jgi:hypothetical protein